MPLCTNHQNSPLLKAFNAHGVEYLVVGGLAVSYYCPERAVDDLDLLINPTLENAEMVKSALVSLGMANFDWVRLTKSDVQLQLKEFHYADIITPEEKFDFPIVFFNSIIATVNGISAHIPSVRDLIKLKSTDRDKDLRDVSFLRHCAAFTGKSTNPE